MPCDVDKHTGMEPNCGKPSVTEGSDTDTKDTGGTETDGKAEMAGKKYRDLVNYRTFIIRELREGNHQAEIVRRLWEAGYAGSRSNAQCYIKSIREELDITIEGLGMIREQNRKAGVTAGEKRYTEKELMERIWMGKGFTKEEKESLSGIRSVLLITERCVREFKKLFEEKNMPQLYIFIEKYRECTIKRLSGFAKSLERDMEAVENAVASEKSNAYVEGTNNRIKMIKRTMFGRCGQKLLSAKMMFSKWRYT